MSYYLVKVSCTMMQNFIYVYQYGDVHLKMVQIVGEGNVTSLIFIPKLVMYIVNTMYGCRISNVIYKHCISKIIK
jgi:hypothetical protein